uniref:C6 domain-containing protein n=1 Tax=Caenorhabditis tropicalis TaxID=1561998 RepID=A0A1I7UF85_9PELO
MTFSSTIVILFGLFFVCSALPPKGCTSCLMVPIEESEKAGISSTNKTRNTETGCFVQTVQCASKENDSDTYIQFNKGRKGLFAAVQQTIQLFCNEEGKWEFRHSKLTLTVNSLTCLST